MLEWLSWALLSSQALSHGVLSSRFLRRPKPALLKSRVAELAVCSPHSPEDLPFHHFMVTALHIPHQTLVVVRSGFSLGCLLVSSSVI